VNVLREVKPERPDFVVLARLEDLILLGLLAGSDGAISGLVHIAPGSSLAWSGPSRRVA